MVRLLENIVVVDCTAKFELPAAENVISFIDYLSVLVVGITSKITAMVKIEVRNRNKDYKTGIYHRFDALEL